MISSYIRLELKSHHEAPPLSNSLPPPLSPALSREGRGSLRRRALKPSLPRWERVGERGGSRKVWRAQILAGLHFGEPADDAIGFRSGAGLAEQVRQAIFRGQNQLDATVVELVHQPGEAPAPVGAPGSESPQLRNQYGVETSCQFDVIGLAARPVADGFEFEPGHARCHAFGREDASLDFQIDLALAGGARDRFESLFHRAFGSGIEREVKDALLLQHPKAIVRTTFDLYDLEVLLDQFDRRQELSALQTVQIKFIRMLVGRGYQDHSMIEQSGEQIAHQHRVTDVGHVEFIEAQQTYLLSDVTGDVLQRIFFPLRFAQSVMDVLHETVEMNPPLACDRNRVEECIHQETLASAHATPEIKTTDRALAREYAQQRITGLLRLGQFVMQSLQIP